MTNSATNQEEAVLSELLVCFALQGHRRIPCVDQSFHNIPGPGRAVPAVLQCIQEAADNGIPFCQCSGTERRCLLVRGRIVDVSRMSRGGQGRRRIGDEVVRGGEYERR